MDYYRCLRTLCDVVELENFSKAAKKRFCSASAVSKQINWLEDKLNIKLFIRNTRKLTITDAGMKVYELAKTFMVDLNALQQNLSNSQNEVMGKIHVTAPTGLAEIDMSNWIHEFLLDYPKVNILFEHDNEIFDLVSKKIDIAIRMKKTADTNYHCDKILDTTYKILASPNYLEKYGYPTEPQNLTKHNCLVHIDRKNPFLWCFKNNEKVFVSGNLQCNSINSLKNSAKDGLGLICLLPYSVHRELADGELIEVLSEYSAEKTTYYLCYLKQEPIPERISKFCEFLKIKLQLYKEMA